MEEEPKKKKIKDVDLAYLAGLFDGEGHVCICERPVGSDRRTTPGHILEVAITNADLNVLVWAKDLFGGNVFLKQEKTERHNRCWRWRIYANVAYLFLTGIVKYLRIKKEQVLLAIQFQELMKEGARKRIPVPEIVLSKRRDFKKRISALAQRNRGEKLYV